MGGGIDGCKTMADWICARYSESRPRAHEIVRVGTRLRDLPHIADALRYATLSWIQARHLVAFVTPETDADWAGRHADRQRSDTDRATIRTSRPSTPPLAAGGASAALA